VFKNELFSKLKFMRKSILTIEDSKGLNYLYSKIFEKEFDVVQVNNFFQAFKHLQSNTFNDLIIINISDTKSDNFKFLKHISTSSLFCNIPKVIISKNNDEELKTKTIDLGVNLFISLPFEPVSLTIKIKEILNDKEFVKPTLKQKIFSFGFLPL